MITTVGPGLDGKGVIEGGTRAFHGAHGTAEEINTITRWDPTVGAIDVLIELRLRYRTTPEPDPFQLPMPRRSPAAMSQRRERRAGEVTALEDQHGEFDHHSPEYA